MQMDFQKILEQFQLWLETVLPRLLGCVIILALGWWLASAITKITRRALERSKADAGIVSFLCSLLKNALRVVVCITAAAQLGIDVTSIIAALGAAGLTVGLALKDSMTNIASGAQIIFTKPFHVGDYLIINNVEGTVERIEIMFTTLRTFDNKEIVIPNSSITVSTITNSTAMDTRRLDLSYSIGYGDDIALAKQILETMVSENELVLSEPQPLIAVGKHKASSVAIVAKLWCKKEDYWTLYYQMQEQVKLEFDKQGINIPYNQLDVHLKSAG